MPRNIIRLIANVAVAVGLFLLVRVIYYAANGSLAAQLFPESQQSVDKHSVCYLPESSGPITCDLSWLRAAAEMAAPSLVSNRLAGGGYLRLLAWSCTGDQSVPFSLKPDHQLWTGSI